MSSRSATVLVIFSVAVIAFCLATVFAAMTGPISILPNESDSGGILDNLSAITDSDNSNSYHQSYSEDSYDYSSRHSDSHSDDSQVETTTDNSKNVETTTTSPEDNQGSESSPSNHAGSSSSSSVSDSDGGPSN
ncbi:hypothetical protein [Methanobrevibacter sp.]|uniref:hypothetical protein n=1 Tax=Methanobrevibacter sp. TaxID=66852 RepID=UPI00386B6CE8